MFACAVYVRSVPSKRHRVRAFFALAVLAIVGGFVLEGAVAGATSIFAMLVFIAACAYALRHQAQHATARSTRTGLGGWFSGWF